MIPWKQKIHENEALLSGVNDGIPLLKSIQVFSDFVLSSNRNIKTQKNSA